MNYVLAGDILDFKVSRLGDTEMSCGSLSQEAVLMRDIITTTQDIKDNTKVQNTGITAAGALGSFLVGTATGGVGVAAAGFLLKHAAGEKGEEADTVQDIAKQRRSLMAGIYDAKGCAGPLDHAMQDRIIEEDPSAMQLATLHPASGEESLSSSRYND